MKIKGYIITPIILSITFGCSHKNIISKERQTPTAKAQETFRQDSLAFELCRIYGFDQGIRDTGLNFNKRELMPKIDSLTFDKVMAFVRANGYPTEALLGERNMNHECVEAAVPAVLLHNPHRLVKDRKNFDLFFNEVKKGNLDKDFFVAVLDKYYWINSPNKKQRRVFYGSQFGKPCIQTKESTNKARIEIGLEPLADEDFIDCGDEVLNMPVK